MNDPKLAKRAGAALARALGEEHVHDLPPVMGGEDFAFFAREVPGFYFRLGTTKPGTTSGGLHTPTFRADDGAVEVGIQAMTAVVLDFLRTPRSGGTNDR